MTNTNNNNNNNNDDDEQDPDEADIASFAVPHTTTIDSIYPHYHDHDGVLRVTITLELPGGWGTNTLPLHVALDVLDRLERDGIRPYKTTISITDKPTT